jgi:xanthine dehydrogenase small subunit
MDATTSKEVIGALLDQIDALNVKPAAEGTFVMSVNGKKIELSASDVDPTLSLNDFIRAKANVTGAKIGCGEGGCGACAVDVAQIVGGKEQHFSVNSCLALASSYHGCAITTTEGLGTIKKGLHPIQERIAAYNGTQCGFCTPGMVMTMFSALKQAGSMEMLEMENVFDGNLCRCTGYRPILDSAKSLCKDSNIVDQVSKCAHAGAYDGTNDPTFPEFLNNIGDGPGVFSGSGLTIHYPSTLPAVFQLMGSNPQGKLVISNTSTGIYKPTNAPDWYPSVYINLKRVDELAAIDTTATGVSFGAAVSLNTIQSTLRGLVKSEKAEKVLSFGPLADHIQRIAGIHVRNAASVAGNLMMAKKKGFESDMATILLGAGATIRLAKRDGSTRDVSMEQFLTPTPLNAGEILHTVTIPFTSSGSVYRSYRAALRPTNAHAFVNAAFQAKTNKSKKLEGVVLAFGCIAPHAKRAHGVEKLLEGQVLDSKLVQQALEALSKEIVPQPLHDMLDSMGEVTGLFRGEYRSALVLSFFYKFMVELLISMGTKVSPALASAAQPHLVMKQRGENVSSGKQAFEQLDDSAGPASLPVNKIEGTEQAAGEIKYVGDVPELPGTAFGAYALSTKAKASIVSLDFTAAREMPGVIDCITADDIQGTNNFDQFMGAAVGCLMPILASGSVMYCGQPVCVVVADTKGHAEAAALKVVVNYGAPADGQEAVLGIDAAKAIADAQDEKTGKPQIIRTMMGGLAYEFKRGVEGEELDKLLAGGIGGEIAIGGQNHFAMEPHVAYAIPTEGERIKVFAATQWPGAVHKSVAGALKLPLNKIEILQRRAGGGFGGKLSAPGGHAAAAAVAANKIGVPVKMVLNRNIDMECSGGREDCKVQYKCAVDAAGKIQAIKIEVSADGGACYDLTPFGCMSLCNACEQTYYFPNLYISTTAYKTNSAPRTAVRGPGEPEGSYIIETIMQHIASSVGLPAAQVQEANLYPVESPEKCVDLQGKPLTHYTVDKMWPALKQKVDFEARQKAVAKFNAENRWRKRGLAITSVKYGVGLLYVGAQVSVFGDGSVQITHGGCEIGQGLHTKVVQACAMGLGKLLGTPIDYKTIEVADTR